MGSQMACHDCDLLQKIPVLQKKATARCIRCGAVLHRYKPDSINRTLALNFAALMLFTLANCYPFMSLRTQGIVHETTMFTGILGLYKQGMPEVALVVLLTNIVFPLLSILGFIYVLLTLKIKRRPKYGVPVFRLLQHIQEWCMMEVFMLGVLVSIVKMAKMATIVPGISLFSFAALIFVLAASANSLDAHLIWEKLDRRK
jgi:paraquat-inducible protein A